jgi:hypothetical protein
MDPVLAGAVGIPVACPADQSTPINAVTRDAILDCRGAMAFAKVCGNPAKASEILDNLPDMPLPLLKKYLAVLGETQIASI